MNHYKNIKLVIALLGVMAAGIGFQACKVLEDDFEDETFDSDALRVLKVSEGDNTLQSGDGGVTPINLQLEIVFSTAVNESALTDAVSVSGNAQFSASTDDTNSFLTLDFENLDYETAYTLSIPAGSYGANGEAISEDYSLTFTTSPLIRPDVALGVSENSVIEGGSINIVATLSETTTEDVVVSLNFGGTATISEDYEPAAMEIVVPAFEQTASIALNTTDDDIVEGAESIIITAGQLVNANEVTTGEVGVAIIDNDLATDLSLKGVMALSWASSGNNGGKAVHLRATADIADLSVYSIGVANNGGGTDGIEFTFPSISVSKGDDILLAREEATLSAYFGDCFSEFEVVIETDAMKQNGDDAIELFSAETVIETYGDADIDGTGMPWEYAESWAYKLGDTWIYGGLGCSTGSSTTQESSCTYPLCLNDLQFQGVMSFETDPSGEGNSTDRERAIHLRANKDIADLSIYGIGIANNGGGSDGREMDLPAISVSEGDHILFIRDQDVESLATYLGTCFSQFDHTAESSGINFNGDDGVELYRNAEVIEVYGDVVDDGTGLFWEYTGSWAFKAFGDSYIYGGVDCSEFSVSNASSGCPYPFCE